MKKHSKITPKGKIVKPSRIVFNPYRHEVKEPGRCEIQRTRRRGLYAHFCFDHNEMLIDETDSEFAKCNCGMPNPKT